MPTATPITVIPTSARFPCSSSPRNMPTSAARSSIRRRHLRNTLPGTPLHLQARASADFIRAQVQPPQRRASGHNLRERHRQGRKHASPPRPAGLGFRRSSRGDTGIPLTQRAQAFVLTPGHPNQLAPHKRPRITLTPTLALRDGKPWLAFSTPGGDSQDQTLLQIFLNVVEFGMNPAGGRRGSALQLRGDVQLLRRSQRPSSGPGRRNRISEAVLAMLRERGHKLVTQGEWGNPTAPDHGRVRRRHRCDQGRRGRARASVCAGVVEQWLVPSA